MPAALLLPLQRKRSSSTSVHQSTANGMPSLRNTKRRVPQLRAMYSVQTGLGKRECGEAGQTAASPAEERELGRLASEHGISPPLPLTQREGRSGEDGGGGEAFNACDHRKTPRSPSHAWNNDKIAASAPLTLSEGGKDALKKEGENIVVVPAPLTPSEGRNGTMKKESRKAKIDDFVSAPLTPGVGRADAPKIDNMKCDKIRQFPALPLTPSEGCSNGQWKEGTLACEEGIMKLMHRASEREHEKYCQEAKVDKAQLGPTTAVKGPCSPGVITTLGRLDVQVHINGRTERMQWRAMSYLDHDIILGADFKNLWAVDTQTVEGEWRVHEGPWMPF
ncbi:hypothetical protein TKK_0015668 [Trichogramma kaykai]|uniref:Uncharacterized protein n=1 Tax=Trichogramma kaykai TaxID=54128 RepID=A0ABD2WBT8_9HYME